MPKIQRPPLYESWRWTARTKEGRDPRWIDFNNFVEDVSPAPESSTLRRKDKLKPFGPNNFFWKPKLESSLDAAKYARAWRASNIDKAKNSDLKRMYGISLEEYEALSNQQNNVCAICKEPEIMKIQGKEVRLAVDHCHGTGKVRGLLCTRCNRGLGGFRDNPKFLMAAVNYISHPVEGIAIPP